MVFCFQCLSESLKAFIVVVLLINLKVALQIKDEELCSSISELNELTSKSCNELCDSNILILNQFRYKKCTYGYLPLITSMKIPTTM